MSTHKPCSVCEGVEHHWLPFSDEDFTGYVCKHCPAMATGVPDPDEYLGIVDEEEITREEYEATHYNCDTCGGEFWDGGTSCTCEEWGESDERKSLLGRVEKALWRLHKHSEFGSWEEIHYYSGLSYVISHRANNDGH
jgi:hypothetical protein